LVNNGIETLLTAFLRGDPAPWPADAREDLPTRLLEAARSHGIQLLLAEKSRRDKRDQGWPHDLRAALADEARAHAVGESLRYVELKRVLSSMREAGVHPLLLKGGQLAYTHYPDPWLRPCSDIDLLIRSADRRAAATVMERLGYRTAVCVSGELATYQMQYRRRDAHVLHELDIHWRLAGPQLFAQLVPFDELARDAVSISTLGDNARGLSAAHALLLACVHRVAHHHNASRLIWIYDIHLIGAGMRDEQWRSFVALAGERQVREVCASGLRIARDLFGTEVPPFAMASLSDQAGSVEPSAAFLSPRQRKVDVLISDLRHLDGWRHRVRLVREHLFPSPDYMLRSSGSSSVAFLPALYLRRIVRGAIRWCRFNN
jgi:hypothetical protein